MRIILFFNNIRGLKVLECFKKEKINVIYLILSKKNLNKIIIAKIKCCKIPFIIVDNINSKKFINFIKKLEPDINIISGFSYIFKKELINTAKYGSINLHAGPLPSYRGGSPLNWQIINNEKNIGVSIIKIDEGIDSGQVILQKNIILIKQWILMMPINWLINIFQFWR